MSFSINLIASSSYHAYQSCHPHNHGTLPPNRFEIRVAMMFADQTNEACRSNIGQKLDGVQSMAIVTTKPLLITKELLSVN